MIHSFKGIVPFIHSSVFMAAGVQVIGDVSVGMESSIWFNTVLRGDLASIRIGSRCNIQDGTIGHVNTNQPLLIGDEVSVGHGVIIHGCEIGRGALIGMGAIILNGAEIGEYALIGAGSLVTERSKIPPFTLVFGSPAKVVRELTDQDLMYMKRTMENYVVKGKEYKHDEH